MPIEYEDGYKPKHDPWAEPKPIVKPVDPLAIVLKPKPYPDIPKPGNALTPSQKQRAYRLRKGDDYRKSHAEYMRKRRSVKSSPPL